MYFYTFFGYKVLGGLHSVTTRQELVKEGKHNDKLPSVEARIFIGLTDGEALRLDLTISMGIRHMK